jgi:hypothetical protein
LLAALEEIPDQKLVDLRETTVHTGQLGLKPK